jgi:biotin-(acetyl-CoA carboxylase) ligase
LCGERKIAGILVEGEGDPVAAAIGFGVNCRKHPPTRNIRRRILPPTRQRGGHGCRIELTGIIDDNHGVDI